MTPRSTAPSPDTRPSGFTSTVLAPPRDDFRPRRAAGMSKGALLAIAAHGLLILALALGLRWRTSTPAVISAELWSATPQQAAPPPPRPVEPPPPPPPPPPEPEVKPAPPPPPPQAQPDPREAEIALERQREAARRAEEERREKREERARQERQERERQEAAERREKERKEQQARQEEEKKKREAAEAKRREQETEQRLARQRDEQLERLHKQIGDGAPSSTATASRAASISTEYAGRIAARIKPHIVFAEDVRGNPAALVEVAVSPAGKIIGRKLVKSSGLPAWDNAVLRAIDRTEVLPRDIDGRVPALMELQFRPNE